MGEAKRRGTREQRIERAKKRNEEEKAFREEYRQEVKMNKEALSLLAFAHALQPTLPFHKQRTKTKFDKGFR